jgi:hypothetical protein
MTREKQFLKNDWIDGEADATRSLGRKQLCCRWLTP